MKMIKATIGPQTDQYIETTWEQAQAQAQKQAQKQVEEEMLKIAEKNPTQNQNIPTYNNLFQTLKKTNINNLRRQKRKLNSIEPTNRTFKQQLELNTIEVMLSNRSNVNKNEEIIKIKEDLDLIEKRIKSEKVECKEENLQTYTNILYEINTETVKKFVKQIIKCIVEQIINNEGLRGNNKDKKRNILKNSISLIKQKNNNNFYKEIINLVTDKNVKIYKQSKTTNNKNYEEFMKRVFGIEFENSPRTFNTKKVEAAAAAASAAAGAAATAVLITPKPVTAQLSNTNLNNINKNPAQTYTAKLNHDIIKGKTTESEELLQKLALLQHQGYQYIHDPKSIEKYSFSKKGGKPIYILLFNTFAFVQTQKVATEKLFNKYIKDPGKIGKTHTFMKPYFIKLKQLQNKNGVVF